MWKGLLLLLFCLAALQACDSEPVREKEQSPEFTVNLFSGGIFNSADFKGRPMVVNFWASWCFPCREEAPRLEKSYQHYKDKGVGFVTIAIQDTEEKAREFVEKYGLTIPTGLDVDDELSKLFSVFGLPTTLIIDGQGLIQYTHLGAITEELLADEIDKIL